MRTVIIGDVHGMLAELRQLGSLVLHRDDCLIFVEVLIDKGPDFAGVVRILPCHRPATSPYAPR